MELIQAQFNTIKEVVETNNEEHIMNTIDIMHPLSILYYKMSNESFITYINKLPEDFFSDIDYDELNDMIVEIDNINFLIYALKELNILNEDFDMCLVIGEMILNFVHENNISNLKLIYDELGFNDKIVTISIACNKPEILKQFINNPYDQYDEDDDIFYRFICSKIMSSGDFIDIVQVYHKDSDNSLDNYDMNHLFKCALVYGREMCMHYALNNSNIEYYYEDEPELEGNITDVVTIYPFSDSIMYAIIGKNMNCIQTVFNIFNNQIKDENWKEYFKFASVYGTLEIIKYMITIKPYLVDQIENFYTNILKFALCEGNLDIVEYAINNGATFSNEFIEFANDYNSGREVYHFDGIEDDYTLFYEKKYIHPIDIKERIESCLRFIHNN